MHLGVYYQPQVETAGLRLIGVEALSRLWTDSGQVLPPDRFIPYLERNGGILQTDWRVCEEAALFLKEHSHISHAAVNFSRQHVCEPDFVERLDRICAKYGISAGRLMIEMTETGWQAFGRIRGWLDAIWLAGYRTAIDDFGCGEASFALLKEVRAEVLKLDKSLIPTGLDGSGWIVVGRMIQMAHELYTDVVAEGIETELQCRICRDLGCDILQGFLFGKPAPADTFVL